MSNPLANNELAIDCNVFEHLWSRDDKYNRDGHIAQLLALLIARRSRLCIDAGNVIRQEYTARIEPLFKKEWQIASEMEILRYWMLPDNQEQVDVSICRELSKLIKTVIIENERADRTYVCVAFSRRCLLVSNDEMHIVIGPDRERKLGERRTRLLNVTRKHRQKGAEILFSQEAHQYVQSPS
jgi:hypothetical protein